MISYSGIYSPNNKNNQKSTAARLVYFRNSRNKKSCNYKCWTFSGFSLPNCNSRTSPMIKYSFFKNHHFLRRLLISSEGSFNFYPSIVFCLIRQCESTHYPYKTKEKRWILACQQLPVYLKVIINCSSPPLSGIRTLHTPVSLSQLHNIDSVSFSKFSSKRSGFTFFIFFPLTVTSFGAFAE